MPLDILIFICLGLNILIFLLLLKMGAKLKELSAKLNMLGRSTAKSSSPTSSSTIVESADPDHDADTAPGTPFEEFLNEDPRRRTLGKKEQFAAYRNWRDEKGLNWNNSNK